MEDEEDSEDETEWDVSLMMTPVVTIWNAQEDRVFEEGLSRYEHS